VTDHRPIAVLLVDDHPLVRQGLHAVLDAAGDIAVVGEAGDGDTAVERSAELQPDVVIMDLQLPGRHGVDATREIVARQPGTAVLVLTMFEDDDMVFSAMSAGAAGYLLKGADGTDIVTAVRAAASGQAVFGAALAQRLRTWFAPGLQPPATPFPQLTDREREILDGVAAGLTNGQIAQQMFLSTKTVANNVSNILGKLQLAERAQAIIAARDAGLGRQAGPREELDGHPVREGPGHRGGAAGDLKLGVDVLQVLAYGALGHAQPPADLGIGVPVGDQVQQLALPGREPRGAEPELFRGPVRLVQVRAQQGQQPAVPLGEVRARPAEEDQPHAAPRATR